MERLSTHIDDDRIQVQLAGQFQGRRIAQQMIALLLARIGMLMKTLYFKDIKDFGGGIKRPATIETDSPLYKGYKSVMLYSGLKKKEFPDEVFTQGFMSRMEELRK